ncbi:MAG: YkgJ family cysteine cluster protein [Arachidicoccus sp.]|nr:YkgJ family cysteine cluster protein [Arachidicoccus sp.]
MQPINFDTFSSDYERNRKSFRSFISRMENNPPENIDEITDTTDKEVWQEIDCLSCANCCKKMTPTFTAQDIKRAATYLHISPKVFKEKWLMYEEKDNDWVNKSQPCQFLDLSTNMCSIYEARPADCAGFPHLNKKHFKDFGYIHKQNIEYCPATMRFIQLLKEKI